ncbi:MAG TPA: hypothetical protein VFV19_14125 [Candidatus Polarisedimenticolaceae bacterium]|nr:hypothetical protein [Candidatus Polarisedimenticolaceae bacterium]
MRYLSGLLVLVLVAASPALAAPQTWVGKISDSDCGAKHMSGSEHEGAKMSDADCVKACIDKGAKYVFVSEGKVIDISNQDFADLKAHAGETVKLTGEKTDAGIAVTKIEKAKKA